MDSLGFELPAAPERRDPVRVDGAPAASSGARPAAPLHIVTPLLDTRIHGRRVGLKLENLQPSRSFKLRGIGLLCQHHAARGATRLVCSSAGNAGLAVAWAGRALGMPVTVVVPLATPRFVIERIAALGADVLAQGAAWDHANAAALDLARAPGCEYIPPFDHPLLWQGHASLVEELAEQCIDEPDAIVLAVGGGGLLLGVLEGLRRVGWRKARVFAVEPEGAAALGPSLARGRVVELGSASSIATSLCVRRIAAALPGACRGHAVTPLVVDEAQVRQACVRMADDHGLVVEPACGVALAPLYDRHPALQACANVVAVVCGGVVVTLEQLAGWSGLGQGRGVD